METDECVPPNYFYFAPSTRAGLLTGMGGERESADRDMYPYASGNRLEDRNTYFFSPFHGRDFLCAWRRCREKARAAAQPDSEDTGEPSINPIDCRVEEPSAPLPSDTGRMLERALELASEGAVPGADDLLLPLLKKFERTKRVFDAYDENLNPRDKNAYHEPAHYVRLAEVFEAAFQRTGALPFLNALLKIMDTLTAMNDALPPRHARRLAWLVRRERSHVTELARRVGVEI